MRVSFTEMDVITQDERVVGVSLGFDFVAEHEQGVRSLQKKFDCDLSLPGLASGLIRQDATYTGEFEEWFYISSSPDLPWPKEYWPEKVCGDYKIKAAWDESDFLMACTDSTVIKALQDAFYERDIAILRGAVGPFGGGGLVLIRYSCIPMEVLEGAEQAALEQAGAEEALKNSKAFRDLTRKQREWKEKYPFSFGTPWGYYCLSPRKDINSLWLNPANQQHVSCGWVSLEDIQDWVDGKPGKIIKDKETWEDLLWELSVPVNHAYSFRKDHSERVSYFRRLNPNFRHTKSDKIPITRNGLNEEYSKILEADIKNELLVDMFRQIDVYDYEGAHPATLREAYLAYMEKPSQKRISPRREAHEYMVGVLRTMNLLKLGTFGACNIDEGRGRGNLSFWRSVIEAECSYDFLDLCGQVPEHRKLAPWTT